jgi:dTDP-4-dehydrorhamnose reductase
MYTIMVIGGGYLGKQFAEFFQTFYPTSLYTEYITDYNQIMSRIYHYRPTHVINCLGKTGRPNIDWCEASEENRQATFFSNVVVPSYIQTACRAYKAKMVHIGSGCVYQGDDYGEGYSEKTAPNYDGSYYSWTKIVSERYLNRQNALQLRIRMPLGDKPDPRNLLTKLLGYSKIVESANSITYIPDLLYVAKTLIEKDVSGIYNVVNKGSIFHSQILKMYEEISGKKLKYSLISEEELDTITKVRRSNCVLSTRKLEDEGIQLRSAITAVDTCIRKYVEAERLLEVA